MYSKFNTNYPDQVRHSKDVTNDFVSKVSAYSKGFTQFAEELSGSSFGNGIYRTHVVSEIQSWNERISEAFPEYRGKIVCFAYDWLGRHFALDQRRIKEGDMQVLLLEPGAGEAMQIPCGIKEFHEEELVDYAEDALSKSFFDDWSTNSSQILNPTECVGYKVPLFLGGKDEIENLEVSDMEVYWSICAQTKTQTKSGHRDRTPHH